MLPGATPALWGAADVSGNDANTLLLLHGDGANNSTVFSDLSPYARGDATVSGGAVVSTAQSKFGGASALFNGTTSFLSFQHHADFNFGTGDFTIDCWVRFNSVASQCAFASKWATADNRQQWLFVWFNSPAALRLNLSTGGSTQTPREYPWTPVINTWYHVAAVRKSGLVYLFVDGVLLGPAITDNSNLIANTEPVRIGCVDNASGAPTLLMNGNVDELRISNIARWTTNFAPPKRAYGPDPDLNVKLLLHMNGANGSNIFVDASYFHKGYAAVTGATITSGPFKFGGAAGLFSGSSYITYPDHADYDFGTGDFTIDLWARVANLGVQYALFGKNTSALNNGFGLYVNTTKTVQCYWTPSDGAFTSFQTAPLVNDTNFHHYVFQRRGTLMEIYFDGVLSQQGSISAGASLVANANLLTIGRLGDFPLFLNGGIDEFRVSKGVARYSATFTPPVAAYPPDDMPAPGGNDAFTKLLMHFDGANGSTTHPDSSIATPKGNAVAGNGAALSTAQSKFGGSSLLLNGTNQNLGYATHADYDFGTGDFTIDWQEYRTVGGANRPIAARRGDTTYSGWLIWSDASNVLFHSSSNNSSWDIANAQIIGAQSLNSWHHFAVTRQGNTFRTFKDGVLTTTFTSSASLLANAGSLSIGWGLTSYFYGGYIDEFRISKGIARWTANFTPPTGPYF